MKITDGPYSTSFSHSGDNRVLPVPPIIEAFTWHASHIIHIV